MALFGRLVITDAGMQEVLKAQSGGSLNFKRIAMGSGYYSGNFNSLKGLVDEEVSVEISDCYVQDDLATIEGFFSNDDLGVAFEWREIGVFVETDDGEEILYCYSNAGDSYDYIPSTSDERYSKRIRIAVAIGNSSNVRITIPSDGSEVMIVENFKKYYGECGVIRTFILPVDSWSDEKDQTITYEGITDYSCLKLQYTPVGKNIYNCENANVMMKSASSNRITISCDTLPTIDVIVDVIYQGETDVYYTWDGSAYTAHKRKVK